MLLSYFAAVLKSPVAALVLSSAVFGFMHVPGDVMRDWSNPHAWYVHATVSPLVKTAIGAFFGALWMRTRSLFVVGAAHSLFNVAPVLARFSEVWN